MSAPPPKKYQHYRWHWLQTRDGLIIAAWSKTWGWAGVPLHCQPRYYAPAIPPEGAP